MTTTVTINLSPEREAALKAFAEAQGMTLGQWLAHIAEQHVPPAKTDPNEWGQRFHALLSSLDPNTPVLSNEAMRRENIYPDRS